MNTTVSDCASDLKAAIAPVRTSITQHSLYQQLRTLEQLQVFMQHHVFAVWDFMSLLKSLQKHLTCVDIPWYPVANTDACYLINEIVLGEESDIDAQGMRTSHYELYLQAMQQAGADTNVIAAFLQSLRQSGDLLNASMAADIPAAAAAFVENTFSIINTPKPWVQAAVFTFGREDLIPDMFYAIVKDLDKQHPGQLSIFKYYLERHIEVDGDHHSQLALEITRSLCQNDPQRWEECKLAVIQCLKSRLALWNGVETAIAKTKRTL